jgi:hypothetical protein
VLAAVQELDKATTAAKLQAARQRKQASGVKIEGRKAYAEAVPITGALGRCGRKAKLSLLGRRSLSKHARCSVDK